MLKWIDEQVVERQHPADADSSVSSNVSSVDSTSEAYGVTCVRNLENCLLNRPSASELSDDAHSSSDSGYQSSDVKQQRPISSSESDTSSGDKDSAYQFTNTSTSSAEADDGLGQLLQQLRLR